MEFYKWNESAQKKIILIGDAEAHHKPRGTKKYTKELIKIKKLKLKYLVYLTKIRKDMDVQELH